MSRLRRGPSWGPSTKSCRAGSGEARVAPGRGDCPLRRFRAEPCRGGSLPANVLHRLQETSGGRAPSPPSATVPSSSIYHTRCPKVHKEKWGVGAELRATPLQSTHCVLSTSQESRGEAEPGGCYPGFDTIRENCFVPNACGGVHCPCPELPQGLGGEGRGWLPRAAAHCTKLREPHALKLDAVTQQRKSLGQGGFS